MPFGLSNVTDLLESLESLHTKTPPLAPKVLSQKTADRINDWLEFHYPTICGNPQTLISIFSFLLPELRADRIYGLREPALLRVITRSQLLGTTRQNALKNWRTSKEGDFSAVVRRVMAQTENPLDKTVTTEYIEDVLNQLAAKCRFSSDALRVSVSASMNSDTGLNNQTSASILEALYRKLTSTQAKWVTRVILKNHLPVVVPDKESHTLSAYHFLLPYLLQFQHDVEKACNLMCLYEYRSLTRFPSAGERQKILRELAAKMLKPEIGVKVGRPEFVKARSCKHASTIALGRRMSMERKYDGEYCQIHIDTSKGLAGDEWLTIFSKSGRDSTGDRVRVHDTIREALLIDKPEERNWTKCIIEGEMVVYNDREKRILEFHHIRSHVNRAGSYIGNASDGRRDRRSHLMIILFDCLLFDSQSLLHQPHTIRIAHLSKVLPCPIIGRMEFAERTEIDFAVGMPAEEKMRELFAQSIVKRWEGFVLKPVDEPYVDLGRRSDRNERTYGHSGGSAAWLKLKKDYIQGCGDTGDFAVIGGAADRARGWERNLKPGALSVFHVGCLLNKDEVQKQKAKPRFKVIFEVTYNISKPDLEWINQIAPFETVPYKDGQSNPHFDLDTRILARTGMKPIDCLFTKPFVFEVMGGGFEKPADCAFYIPRHPRVCKIYWERSFLEAMSFEELQETAEAAVKVGSEDYEDMVTESQWIGRLLGKDLGARELKRGDSVMESETHEEAVEVVVKEELGEGIAGLGLSKGDLGMCKLKRRQETAMAGEVERPKYGNCLKPKEQIKATVWGSMPENGSGAIMTNEKGSNVCLKKTRQTTNAVSGVALKQKRPEICSEPVEQAIKAAASPSVIRSGPVTALRDISQQINKPGRRSSSGSTAENHSPLDARTAMSSPKRTGATPSPSGPDNKGHPSKKIRLTSTPSKIIEKQLIQEQCVRQQCTRKEYGGLPPPFPSCATTTGDAILELKNGHSRISPLLKATVFLPHYLMKFPELITKISGHDAGIIHQLPATAEDVPALMPASKKGVVLVEPNKTSLTKKTLKGLSSVLDIINKDVEEGQRYGFEVYDWRIVNKRQPEGMWEVDWSLLHVWSVV